MDEDMVFTKRFVDCVRKPQDQRTEPDLDYICHTLKKLSEFTGYDSASLRAVPWRLVYEQHSKDSILYSVGDSATCWYYVLAGSVLLSMNYLFSTGSSFGRCVNSNVRSDQCHILEPTELLRINYTEEELQHFAQRAAKKASRINSTSMELSESSALEKDRQAGNHTPETAPRNANGSISTVATSSRAEETVTAASDDRNERADISEDFVIRRRKKLAHGDRNDAIDLELIAPISDVPVCTTQSADLLERNRRSRSEERPYFSFDPAVVKKVSLSRSNDSLDKAMEDPVRPSEEEPTSTEVVIPSRSRNRERRYSAPPERRIRDSVGSMDYLSESQVDSDDEDSFGDQSETSASTTSMDAVWEVLSKPSGERTDEDIERVMDVLQYMPVFSNMTSNIRRALFQVLMLSTVENENTVLIDNGEEVKSWYVVLNGQLKLQRDSEGGDKTYHVGDWFGVSQSLKILPQRGRVVSVTKDCTVGYVSVTEYGRILTQGEENMRRIEEDGKVVTVLERRAVDVKREGYFIVQATPEKLLEHLLEESVDGRFHRDFLLTYRTFLKSPAPIIEALRTAWETGLPEQRERITMIVLYWVTEHFPDFEGNEEMTDFLDWFEARLLEDGKVGEKRALDKARSLHSKIRNIEMDRAGTNSPLSFEVVGGWELGHPIFVSAVEPNSIPERAGLRVGDQILEINDAKCVKKELREVLSILRKNFKLSLRVRSNLPEFKQFMSDPPKAPPEYNQKSKAPYPLPLAAHVPIARCNSDARPASADLGPRSRAYTHVGPGSPKSRRKFPKIIKPLHTFGKLTQLDKLKKLRIRSSTFFGSHHGDGTDSPAGPIKAKGTMTRKSSESLLDSDRPNVPVRASSMEDIHTLSTQTSRSRPGGIPRIVDAVVKLYLPDHSHKYIDISPTTTIAELISRGVKEFFPDKFIVAPADEYCICMVTVQSRNGPIRNSVLPNHMTDLANFIGLESRYYLKERAFHGTLVQDEEAEHIFKESRQWEHILGLSPKQVAEELTRQDSEVFSSVDASEYICDLWRNPDHLTKENLSKFENIPNDEMYWVVTTVISETRADMRAKIIKHFIKIARCCKEQRNYNTMFHILSGLNHGLVLKLRSTWEKVPSKHKRNMEELLSFMNPFHNMAKYRELQRNTRPPLIPFFPIIKKDLTFLYDGNETQVDGLVNFEKLRMLSQQIRVVKTFCQQTIMPEPPQIDLGQLGLLKSLHHSIRVRNRGSAAMATLTDNALKKVYHHHRMMKMVRKHLARKYVVQEEDLLEKIADSSDRMVQIRKNPPSPLRGKRAAHKEKHKSATLSISPSPTTGSFGSDTAVPGSDFLGTPPLSPRKLSTHSSSGLVSSSPQDSITPPRSPSMPSSFENANGSAQCPK